MKIKIFTLFLLSSAFVVLIAAPVTASASPIETFDSSLSGPGVYFGTGNINSGWDVVTGTNTDGSQLQLGLEGLNRYVGPITPTTNDYVYSPGPGTSPNLAKWDFAFSVNTAADPLSAYTYSIVIADTTTGAAFVFNPTLLPDNAQVNSSGTVVCNGCATNLSNSGFQNAENLGFGFLPGFNPNAADNYSITLSAIPQDGSVDPSVTIDLTPMSATPEPSSLGLLGTGFAGLGGLLRWKGRKLLSAGNLA